MRRLLDLPLLLLAALASPFWAWRLARAGKLRTDWAARLGRGPALPSVAAPTILLHAVSVGEVNAIRLLVDRLAGDPRAPRVVVAATTDTGFARARELFAPRHAVLRTPYDLAFAMERFLDRVRPDVVGLVELEVWPNMTADCARRGIPVAVVNGRLSARSLRRYRRVRLLVRPAFRRLALAAVQGADYRDRFAELGVQADRIQVTGTMKWDAARLDDEVEGAAALAAEMGIDRGRPLVVAGSTAPEEHALLRDAIERAGPEVQLLVAPRRPEWFDDAARALPGCRRRTAGRIAPGAEPPRFFLLDTIGELRSAYALADLVVVGRSFGARWGSDMMEPIALGKATVVGPATGDFADTMERLRAGDGIVETTRDALPETIAALLGDPARRAALAEAGRAVIRREQGATEANARLLLGLLAAPPVTPEPAAAR